MDAKVVTDFRRALASGNVNRAAVDYLEARLAEVKETLIYAKDDAYRQLQGRAMELSDLIKLTKQLREP